MAEVQGLEKAVWDQFEEDFCGLRDTANALNDSWKQTPPSMLRSSASPNNRLWLPSILSSSARFSIKPRSIRTDHGNPEPFTNGQ